MAWPIFGLSVCPLNIFEIFLQQDQPMKVDIVPPKILWSSSWICWSVWFQCIATSDWPVIGKTTIIWPFLGLMLTRERVLEFQDWFCVQDNRCLLFQSTRFQSCCVTEFVNSKPLFLFSLYLFLSFFQTCLVLLYYSILILTWVFYTGF